MGGIRERRARVRGLGKGRENGGISRFLMLTQNLFPIYISSGRTGWEEVEGRRWKVGGEVGG